MEDKIYGIEDTIDTLDNMGSWLSEIFKANQASVILAEQTIAVEAAKAFVSVATAAFNIRSSPAWKNSDDYEMEMAIIKKLKEPRQKTPEPEQRLKPDKQPEQDWNREHDRDGPEIG